MGKIEFKLPGGRGVLKGPDAQAISGELTRKRAQEVPSQDALLLENMDHTGTLYNIYPPVNYAVFTLLPKSDRILLARYARISVIVNSVGYRAETALYVLGTPGDRNIRMVPGTKAKFDVGTAGILTANLLEDRPVFPSGRLVMGFWSNAPAKTLELAGQDVTISPAVQHMNYPTSTGLPDYFQPNKVKHFFHIPHCAYMSTYANEVF